MTLELIDGIELGRLIRRSPEFALLDLRPAEAFGTGAPLHGANVPLDRLAGNATRLVPHRHTPVILLDAKGESLADAGRILEKLGYRDLHGLAGGLDGNQRLPVFPIRIAGPRVISGDIERRFGTPVITPAELVALREHTPVVVLDTRPVADYEAGHVPGSIPAPGAEILPRLLNLDLPPDTHVVTTCAGRSRAVLAAQILIEAGVPYPVATLDFGTLGWVDAGLDLGRGPEVPLAPLRPEDLARAADALAPTLSTFRQIDTATLDAWLQDEARTTFALDVRLPEDFDRAHLPGTVNAPGGQLGILVGGWVGVQGARLVLVDDPTGIRAATTGRWLQRIGWEVAILRHDFAAATG